MLKSLNYAALIMLVNSTNWDFSQQIAVNDSSVAVELVTQRFEEMSNCLCHSLIM